MIQPLEQKIEEILTRSVADILPSKEALKKVLLSGRKLRIKHGIDPTSPDLHLGNAVILWKLKEFQALGHKIVLIIGNFTAKIGDPSGRLSARKILTDTEIRNNMRTYKKQVGQILSLKKTDIIYNSGHLSKLSFAEIYRISHFFSANQILERDMFQERKKQGRPIWLHEFFYPVFQAYDSVAVKANLEIGGSDQLFNMMMARQLQPHFRQFPQNIMTMKILVGADGKSKMSKSFGNYIGIQEPARQQFGKIMSIKDELIPEYFELCTFLPFAKIEEIRQTLKNGRVNPRDIKEKLSFEIVKIYHGAKEAEKAQKEFKQVFSLKKTPEEAPEIKIVKKNIPIVDLLLEAKFAPSRAEAKRLIEQGAVQINNKKILNWQEIIKIENGAVLQAGKRKFARLR